MGSRGEPRPNCLSSELNPVCTSFFDPDITHWASKPFGIHAIWILARNMTRAEVFLLLLLFSACNTKYQWKVNTACKCSFFMKGSWMRCSEILLIEKFLTPLEPQFGYNGPKNMRPRILRIFEISSQCFCFIPWKDMFKFV